MCSSIIDAICDVSVLLCGVRAQGSHAGTAYVYGRKCVCVFHPDPSREGVGVGEGGGLGVGGGVGVSGWCVWGGDAVLMMHFLHH